MKSAAESTLPREHGSGCAGETGDHKLGPACLQRLSLEQAGMKPGFCKLKLTGGVGSIRIGLHGMFGKFD
jgi:hypothetical protein